MTWDVEADYIIVGAGSSGCVIANRLTEDPAVRVLLLEAGGDHRPLRNPRNFRSNMAMLVPAGFSHVMHDPRVGWNFTSEPEPSVNGRTFAVPRGKVLGGSSAINGLAYVRGLPSDYDTWRQLGCVGWAWDDVLPLFKRSERVAGGDPAWQGRDGPQSVSWAAQRYETADAVLAACAEFGVPAVPAVNAISGEGVCYSQISTRNGLRASTAASYLHPAMRRRNLRVETQATTERIIFEGRRAIGVAFRHNGQPVRARARAEVILAGGSIGSPQLLQVSGVGPGALLAEHGVEVVADRAQVGENLHDHFLTGVRARLKPGRLSLNQLSRGLPLLGQLLQFVTARRGMLVNCAGLLTGYMRSNPEIDHPDFQFFASPATTDTAASLSAGRLLLEAEPGLTMMGNRMRPVSRGHIRIASSDLNVKPRIRHNYLADHSDQAVTIAMMRILRSIMGQPALAHFIDHEFEPGVECTTDEQLLEHAKAYGGTAYHPVGSCRMGSDEASVVDPQLRVRGVEGLRVADASVMPQIVSANTNAACIMIGEKAADLMMKTPAMVH